MAAAWAEHARACYPAEACAYVTTEGLMPVRNVSGDAGGHFQVRERDYLTAEARGLLGFLHSHPTDGKDGVTQEPSSADMVGQLAMAKPWGISLCDGETVTRPVWFGDQVPVAPLVGRPFVHGVFDCYSLIRDWYRLNHEVTLVEIPRDMDWWHNGGDLYEQGFERHGWRRVPLSDIREGDAFLCRVRAKVLNHAGLYVGNGVLLHHLWGQLSLHSPAEVWRSKLDFIIRHESLEGQSHA